MTLTQEQQIRSDQANEIADRTAFELQQLGYDFPASWRILVYCGLAGIRAGSGVKEAIADLQRIKGDIDRHIQEIESGVPQ
jgi:hypothetical protein